MRSPVRPRLARRNRSRSICMRLPTTGCSDCLRATRSACVLPVTPHAFGFYGQQGGEIRRRDVQLGQTALAAEGRWLILPGSVGQPRDALGWQAATCSGHRTRNHRGAGPGIRSPRQLSTCSASAGFLQSTPNGFSGETMKQISRYEIIRRLGKGAWARSIRDCSGGRQGGGDQAARSGANCWKG